MNWRSQKPSEYRNFGAFPVLSVVVPFALVPRRTSLDTEDEDSIATAWGFRHGHRPSFAVCDLRSTKLRARTRDGPSVVLCLTVN